MSPPDGLSRRAPRPPGAVRCALALLLTACGGRVIPSTPLQLGRGPQTLEGFAACSDAQPGLLDLASDEPLVVITHGCFASGSQFRELSRLFEFNGQRTVCFNYDDRHGLRRTARVLRRGLDALRAQRPSRPLTLLGHSQGGLIARIAVSEVSGEPGGELRLVTVSSPFAGIAAAEHCGLVWLHLLSFGITPGICQAITGAKWTEIHPNARLWQEPRPLDDAVSSHLRIVTDEAGTCRRRGGGGACEEDDLVFTLEEQQNPRLDASDGRLRTRVIAVGHAAVTGSHGHVPRELVAVLQEEGVLAHPAPGAEVAFEELLRATF